LRLGGCYRYSGLLSIVFGAVMQKYQSQFEPRRVSTIIRGNYRISGFNVPNFIGRGYGNRLSVTYYDPSIVPMRVVRVAQATSKLEARKALRRFMESEGVL
jgi:hypothetical protein